MQVEILDEWDAYFKMCESEFLEWRDVMEAANRRYELIEVSSKADYFRGPTIDAIISSRVYFPIAVYTVEVNPDWRGALEEYATAAFLEGRIDADEAATLSRLAASR